MAFYSAVSSEAYRTQGGVCLHTQVRADGTRRYAVLSVTAGVLLVLVLGLLVLWQEKFLFAYSQPWLLANRVLLPLALSCITLLVALRHFCARRAPRWGAGRWLVAVYFLFLLGVQLVVAHAVWFYAGWDVSNVYGGAEQLAKGLTVDGAYYRLCPNNAPLTLLLALPLWMAESLKLAVPYAVLPYLGAVLANLACQLTLACVRRLTRSRFARLGALGLCTVWLALSMTMTVPYTDVFALLFPVLAFYVWLSVKGPFAKWGLISLICFFGASIKPTVLIVEIALVAVSALGTFPLRRLGAAGARRVAIGLIALLLGAVPGRVWQDGATAYLAGSATPQEQLSETHYLMMGMNGTTYGGHLPEDVAYSTSFATLAERRQANLQRAWERVTGRNLAENLYFFAVKTYKAFGDGMLASNNSYLMEQKTRRDDPLSRFLRSVYYPTGDLHSLAVTVEQTVWLGLLALCAVALLSRTRRRPAVAALGLTLFGAGLYLLLFEDWPRYLYLYAPLFIVLAALGLERLRLPRRAPHA